MSTPSCNIATTRELTFRSKDDIHTSNPFTNLSNIVSALTTIGHMDVYSLSRESIQRMLPASVVSKSATGSNGSSAPPRPANDTRQFQYRYSMTYIRSLPEGQRPVEREVFGKSSCSAYLHHSIDVPRPVPITHTFSMEGIGSLRAKLPEYRAAYSRRR